MPILSRRYRAIMDFHVGLHRLTSDTLRRKALERVEANEFLDTWKVKDEVESYIPDDEALAPQRMLQLELERDAAALDRWFRAELGLVFSQGSFNFEDFDSLDGWEILRRSALELKPASRAPILQDLDSDDLIYIDEFWFSIDVELTSLRLQRDGALERGHLDPDDVAVRSYRAIADADITVHPVTAERALNRSGEWMAEHSHEPSWRGWEAGVRILDADEFDMVRELQAAVLRDPESLDLILKDALVTKLICGGVDVDECPDADLVLYKMTYRLPAFHRATLMDTVASEGLSGALAQLFWALQVEMRGVSLWERP